MRTGMAAGVAKSEMHPRCEPRTGMRMGLLVFRIPRFHVFRVNAQLRCNAPFRGFAASLLATQRLGWSVEGSLQGFEKAWQYHLTFSTFVITFLVSQAYGFWSAGALMS